MRDRQLTAQQLTGSARSPLGPLLTGSGGNQRLIGARADFKALTEEQKRQIVVRDRQRVVLGEKYKGKKQPTYGVLFPDAEGDAQVTPFALRDTPEKAK